MGSVDAILHFFDLAVSNAWLLYKLECIASAIPNRKVLDLLEIRMQIEDGLTIMTILPRRTSKSEDKAARELNNNSKFRRSNQPSQAKMMTDMMTMTTFRALMILIVLVPVEWRNTKAGQRLGEKSATITYASQGNKIVMQPIIKNSMLTLKYD